ncbi:MAG TPA: hypothetical protein VK908_02790 [Jiangellales bacterium]|nr:hypothetical protein [Jiangellales bacterium]
MAADQLLEGGDLVQHGVVEGVDVDVERSGPLEVLARVTAHHPRVHGFGVGLFDLHGTLALTEAATLVGVALIQVWWAISFMAGARGNGSGVASAGILGAGWAALTNGFPIVYCPPVCEEARPLTDLGHVGSIVFGILLALVAIWSLWRARVRPGWFMPAVAAALVVGTVVSLANTPIT